MPTTYPEKLSEWLKVREAKKPSQDKNMVLFLAARSDVQAALNAGYSMKTIWEHMKETGRLQCRYETFTRLVKRHIKSAPIANQPTTTPNIQTKSTKPEPKSEPPKISGFTFDPTPNKDELL